MNDYDIDILRFASQGYCCSQIILLLALELQNESNPSLVRTVSALCHGFPAAQGVCGALTGSACLIGFFAGKGHLDEEEHHSLPKMLDELSQWFDQYCISQNHGNSCNDIVDIENQGGMTCGNLISECYGKALSILVEHDFEPRTPHVS